MYFGTRLGLADRVDFPLQQPPGAVLCVGTWKGVGNPAVFWLPLST